MKKPMVASRRALKMGVKGCGHLDSLVTSTVTLRSKHSWCELMWDVQSMLPSPLVCFKVHLKKCKKVRHFLSPSIFFVTSFLRQCINPQPPEISWLGCGKTIVLAHPSRPRDLPKEGSEKPWRCRSFGELTAHGSGNEAFRRSKRHGDILLY